MGRLYRHFEVVALLVIGMLCLAIILSKDEPSHNLQTGNIHINVRKSFSEQPSLKLLPESMGQYASPPCERNFSAANISGFSTLPGHIQDFLFYRHCRHFPMLLNVPDKCGSMPHESADVFLLLVIKSSPWNYDRREVLRKTWAKERLQNGVWIRRVFISGTVGTGIEKRKLNKLMRLENREHHDILQWDFNDSFFNLTLKQILFLEWMQKCCPQVRFLLNGDDDIFANTDNMVEYLQSLDGNDGSKHLFVGHLIRYVGPIRESGSKYFVPVQVQESNSYPPYCGGGGFLLSGFTARVIYNMSHIVTILPIDDVYMGMCLEKAGLEPVSHFGVRTAGLHVPSHNVDAYDPCYYRDIILVHRFLPHQIFIMWHGIHEPDLKCGSSQISNSET
ncbi:N-acetyllactosaminide beta-1,3-N-acetylglucosaminyltransferase 3-like [Anguilla anguilla]|uniref:N-acetyllactosaminide beta-1,3-N-acetylglucosaminyltransferase 3-like n=1 Tax=Anguilla anguilla TaxID=7936 RepID=UPI0015B1F5E0|nr:N-acetyllactosaminide beta-1,3-N-acetylglucosaminyltransferase 3-like [Anguilla anguilla]XP_035271930.1 N-acetyllactosaminide beta-1,3-N-acetylglucosaminyltransferase 3-like [Anguilla anguilla]